MTIVCKMKKLSKIHRFGVMRENLSKLYKAVKLNRKIQNVLHKPEYNQNTFTCKSEYFFSFITEDDEVNVLQKLPLHHTQHIQVPHLKKIYSPEFLELSEPYTHSFGIPNILRNSYYINTTPGCTILFEKELQLIANYNYITHAIKNVVNNGLKFRTIEMQYMNVVYDDIRLL